MDKVQDQSAFSAEDERALLDMIDRWLEKDVRPVVKDYDLSLIHI